MAAKHLTTMTTTTTTTTSKPVPMAVKPVGTRVANVAVKGTPFNFNDYTIVRNTTDEICAELRDLNKLDLNKLDKDTKDASDVGSESGCTCSAGCSSCGSWAASQGFPFYCCSGTSCCATTSSTCGGCSNGNCC